MDSRTWKNGHLREEILEEYSFGRLNDQDSEVVEEHYLACSICQHALEAVEDDIHTVRTAFATSALHPPARTLAFWERVAWWLEGAWRSHQPALLATCLAVLTVAALATYGWRSGLATSSISSPVLLASYRGAEASQMAKAPAGRPLDLRMNRTDVPDPEHCRLEVVNAMGVPQWSGKVTVNGSQLLAEVPQRLRAGQYWVRIYTSDNTLLREFGLRLE